MKIKLYIVKGHVQPFWYRKHVSLDGKLWLKTLVLVNIGIQWNNS
jgi:hypothetical protein